MSEKKLHITFDYELFFGSRSGSVEKCMLEPTQRLLELASRKKAGFVFFIDAGYLKALKENSEKGSCAKDLERVSAQIRQLRKEGHEVALHVHPHWEDCTYGESGWKIDTKRYKLSDFAIDQAKNIITEYHHVLKEMSGVACKTFRAGGWCIQPFTHFKEALASNGIYNDSSVFRNGKHEFTAHSYDFTSAPDLESWKFEEDVCVEKDDGRFTEFAITPDVIPPVFYYTLYFKMKTRPQYYRPIGDGSWLKDRRKIQSQFYFNTNHFACCDGYFASRLSSVLSRVEREGKKRMVVLGHPKSMAPCSFDLLEGFMDEAVKKEFNICTIA